MQIIQYHQELGLVEPYNADPKAIEAAARKGFQPAVEVVKTYSGGKHYVRLEALGQAQADTRIKPDGTRVQTNMLPEVWDVLPKEAKLAYLGGEYLERAQGKKTDEKAEAKPEAKAK